MNKNRLNAAVKHYSPLHEEGKSEEEILGALKADEKGYTDEEAAEIYAAITAVEDPEGEDNDDDEVVTKTGKAANGKKYTVTVEFRDIDNYAKVHKVGTNVSHFKQDRLNRLERNGYVKAK